MRSGSKEQRHVWASGLLRAGQHVTVQSSSVATYLRALEARDAAARCNPKKRKKPSLCERLVAAAASVDVRPPCVSISSVLSGAGSSSAFRRRKLGGRFSPF